MTRCLLTFHFRTSNLCVFILLLSGRINVFGKGGLISVIFSHLFHPSKNMPNHLKEQTCKKIFYKAFVNWVANFGAQFKNFKFRIVIQHIFSGDGKTFWDYDTFKIGHIFILFPVFNKATTAATKILLSTFGKWYFVSKIVLTYCEKNCYSDWEKLLKLEAEGREFSKILRSLEQFNQTVKGQNNFVTEYFFNLILEVSQI